LLLLYRAIKKFTAAIKADPTYERAYVCRAEAYTRTREVRDFSGQPPKFVMMETGLIFVK